MIKVNMCTEFCLEVESSTCSPLNATAVVFASSHNFGGKWCLAGLLSAHNLTASFKELLQLTPTVTKLTSGGPQGIMFYQILTKFSLLAYNGSLTRFQY